MKNLNEFSREFFDKEDKFKKTMDDLVDQLSKIHTKIGRLKKPTVSNTMKPLILAIQKELKAKAYYTVGESGMYRYVTIYWVTEPDMLKCRREHEAGQMTITTSDDDWVIVEIDEDDYRNKEYIKIHGKKGYKWLAKYAKENLIKSRIHNGK